MIGLAIVAEPSVHSNVAQHLIYVRRSYKEATAADVSDEMQEAACRAILPPGAPVRVISDSGGHQSGFSAARDGYQTLLQAVAAGDVTTIAVYDLSRLNRNARLMLDLRHELEARQVTLLVANLPNTSFDGAAGRFMFGQLCVAAQFQRDLDSERMTGMQRRLFEDGRHRGHDPLGYRSRREVDGGLSHPRELEIVPEEAEIVRRVWRELARHSLNEVAELLNREGVPHAGAWTRDAVKDIWRRGRFYLGFVVEKRGREERPGRHESILTDAAYQRTTAAVAARKRVGNKPKPFRNYVLRGLLTVSAVRGCGARLTSSAAPSAAITAVRRSAAEPGAARPMGSRARCWHRSPAASCRRRWSTPLELSCAGSSRPPRSRRPAASGHAS
jgi:DNA invertase Pin-like site-specific DNA recombinase